MSQWDKIDQHHCAQAFEEVSGNIRDLAADGIETTEKDWQLIRRELQKATPDGQGLNCKEAEQVFAALRKRHAGETVAPVAEATPAEDVPAQPAPPTEGDWIPTPDWPGYAVDMWGRLKDIAGGARGRKVGRIISQTRLWVNRAGKGQPKKFQFRIYYQITVNGKPKKIPYYDVCIARNRLEGKRRYES